MPAAVIYSTLTDLAPNTEVAHAVAVQTDGKIVVGGDSNNTQVTQGQDIGAFTVVRYNADLSLDTSFGTSGVQTTYITPGQNNAVRAMAIQSDGKIVLAGWTATGSQSAGDDNFAIARYTTSGVLDTSFGSGKGYVTTNVADFMRGKKKGSPAATDHANAVAIDPNGNLIAVGWANTPTGSTAMAIARYTPTGTLDTSFNSTGPLPGTELISPVANSANQAYSVLVEPVGSTYKIVVGGNSSAGPGHFLLVRLNSDGTLDTSFATNGIYDNSSTLNGSGAEALALDSSGNIVASGSHWGGVANNFLVLRFTSGGALDTTFNSTGYVVTDVANLLFGSGNTSDARSLAIQQNGNIVAGGWVAIPDGFPNAGNGEVALASYNPNGTPDTTFSSTGVFAFTPGGAGDAQAYGIALESSGNIVTAGYGSPATSLSDYQFGVAVADPPPSGGSSSTPATASHTDSSSPTDGLTDLQSALAELTAGTGGPATGHEASTPIRVADGHWHSLQDQDWSTVVAGKHGREEPPLPHLGVPARPTDLLDGVFANWSHDWALLKREPVP